MLGLRAELTIGLSGILKTPHESMKPKKLLLCLALVLIPVLAPAAQPLDRIVAVVNDGVVLQSELDIAMNTAQEQIKSRDLAAPPIDILRQQVLERLIVTRIQTQRAGEIGIRVDDRELNEVLTNIAKQNGMALAEFAQSIREQGGDYLAVREQVRDEVLIQRLRAREVESQINVSEQDIAFELANQKEDDKEVRLGHILVAVPDGASADERDAARAKAEALRQRIIDGEDFAQVAIAQSDGQQALQGGDLDWRRLGDLPTLFSENARKLSEGEISPVLEATSGFHILMLNGLRGGEPRRIVTETKAAHILLMPNAIRDEEATRLQAREIYDRLQGGEDLADLARQYSDDPGSKNSGGELGWQPPGVFAPEFQIRIDQLQPGEISQPFRTQFGWHVAKVLDRRSRDVTEESQRARARQAIVNRRMAEEYDVWLRRLRDEAYVEYRLADGSVSTTSPGG